VDLQRHTAFADIENIATKLATLAIQGNDRVALPKAEDICCVMRLALI
jgi:hypothetical protein